MAISAEQQELLLAIVPKVTASLGLPSALLLMYLIYVDHQKNKGNSMLRALFLVSFFEAFDAFAWFLSTWAAPKGSFALSAGNQASCSFQGFWLQFVIGAPLSNCALAFYFYLVVMHDKSSTELVKWEKVMQSSIFVYALITSIVLLALGQYNHIGAVCWVNGSPPGCDHSVYKSNPDVPCERGNWAWLYGMALFYVPLWFCIVMILVLELSIYAKLSMGDTSEADWFAAQSFLYALAFLVTWTPSTVWSAMHWSGGGGWGLDLASAICEPLAGFWNLLIFLRNRPNLRKRFYERLCCKPVQDEQAEELEAAPEVKKKSKSKRKHGEKKKSKKGSSSRHSLPGTDPPSHASSVADVTAGQAVEGTSLSEHEAAAVSGLSASAHETRRVRRNDNGQRAMSPDGALNVSTSSSHKYKSDSNMLSSNNTPLSVRLRDERPWIKPTLSRPFDNLRAPRDEDFSASSAGEQRVTIPSLITADECPPSPLESNHNDADFTESSERMEL